MDMCKHIKLYYILIMKFQLDIVKMVTEDKSMHVLRIKLIMTDIGMSVCMWGWR